MEHLGTAYAIIVNDPQLRKGLIVEAERSRRSADLTKPRASLRLRFGLAGALRALAVRIEPRLSRGSESVAQHPVFVE